jgi:hypothetical protein
MTRRLLRPLWILLALIFLFEAWLWDRSAPIVAWIIAWIPLETLKRRLAAWIEGLPPAATLGVFIVPFILLLPLKFLEVWFLAHRNWVGAIAVLIVAKLLGLGVTAFIFDLTRPKLLQLAWFRRFYGWVLWALERAHALLDPVRARIRLWFRMFAPKRAGRTLRLLMRIRRRAGVSPSG